eukprot:6672295-Prymnesium_polylepis.1
MGHRPEPPGFHRPVGYPHLPRSRRPPGDAQRHPVLDPPLGPRYMHLLWAPGCLFRARPPRLPLRRRRPRPRVAAARRRH